MFNIHKKRTMYSPTVKELIELLQDMPQDVPVSICGDNKLCMHVDETFGCTNGINLDVEDLDECYEEQFKTCYNLIPCAHPVWIVMYYAHGNKTYSSYVIANDRNDAVDVIAKHCDISIENVFRTIDAKFSAILVDAGTLSLLTNEAAVNQEVKDFLSRFIVTSDQVYGTVDLCPDMSAPKTESENILLNVTVDLKDNKHSYPTEVALYKLIERMFDILNRPSNNLIEIGKKYKMSLVVGDSETNYTNSITVIANSYDGEDDGVNEDEDAVYGEYYWINVDSKFDGECGTEDIISDIIMPVTHDFEKIGIDSLINLANMPIRFIVEKVHSDDNLNNEK